MMKQWFLDGSKISFHWLKENIEEEIVLRDNMAAQNRAEDVERCGINILCFSKEKYLERIIVDMLIGNMRIVSLKVWNGQIIARI